MKKKLLSLLLSLVCVFVCAFGLVACGDGASDATEVKGKTYVFAECLSRTVLTFPKAKNWTKTR